VRSNNLKKDLASWIPLASQARFIISRYRYAATYGAKLGPVHPDFSIPSWNEAPCEALRQIQD
jgi:hypothetical protein